MSPPAEEAGTAGAAVDAADVAADDAAEEVLPPAVETVAVHRVLEIEETRLFAAFCAAASAVVLNSLVSMSSDGLEPPFLSYQACG